MKLLITITIFLAVGLVYSLALNSCKLKSRDTIQASHRLYYDDVDSNSNDFLSAAIMMAKDTTIAAIHIRYKSGTIIKLTADSGFVSVRKLR